MTDRRIEFTGFGDYLPEDRPALYLGSGRGNLEGVHEASITYYNPEDGEEIHLGWVSVHALRDALDALEVSA